MTTLNRIVLAATALLGAAVLPTLAATPLPQTVTLTGVVEAVDAPQATVSIGGLPLLARGWEKLLHAAAVPRSVRLEALRPGEWVRVRLEREAGRQFHVVALRPRTGA